MGRADGARSRLPTLQNRFLRYHLGMTDVRERIPVVGGLGYRETVLRLPSTFTATLHPEPDNRYFRHALAVLAGGEKVGYVAPEVAIRYYDGVAARPDPVTCPARRGAPSDHNTSGVELLLDFTGLPVTPAE
jgi:hypothetical protein